MASAEFDESSAEKRPAVQVGDPFMEKLLLEACLEVMKTGALVGIQDMGAAGLTCSTCEMGARGGMGIDFDVTKVPQRETGMTPYEILLSESQERMLMVVKRGREQEVERHLREVGSARGANRHGHRRRARARARARQGRRRDSDRRAHRRSAGVRPADREPDWLDDGAGARPSAEVGRTPDARQALLTLLASPTIASKRWIYRQYDRMVRTNTLLLAGAGAAAVRVKGTKRALAMSIDGNGRYG